MSLEYLIIHSTNTIKDKNYHLEGQDKSLYSDIIKLNGDIVLSSINKQLHWNTKHNGVNIDINSRHIAYTGGVNKENTHAQDTRTKEQKETLEIYVKYMIKRHPKLIIAGYNQFKDRSSPGFSVGKWLESIGVNKNNMLT